MRLSARPVLVRAVVRIALLIGGVLVGVVLLALFADPAQADPAEPAGDSDRLLADLPLPTPELPGQEPRDPADPADSGGSDDREPPPEPASPEPERSGDQPSGDPPSGDHPSGDRSSRGSSPAAEPEPAADGTSGDDPESRPGDDSPADPEPRGSAAPAPDTGPAAEPVPAEDAGSAEDSALAVPHVSTEVVPGLAEGVDAVAGVAAPAAVTEATPEPETITDTAPGVVPREGTPEQRVAPEIATSPPGAGPDSGALSPAVPVVAGVAQAGAIVPEVGPTVSGLLPGGAGEPRPLLTRDVVATLDVGLVAGVDTVTGLVGSTVTVANATVAGVGDAVALPVAPVLVGGVGETANQVVGQIGGPVRAATEASAAGPIVAAATTATDPLASVATTTVSPLIEGVTGRLGPATAAPVPLPLRIGSSPAGNIVVVGAGAAPGVDLLAARESGTGPRIGHPLPRYLASPGWLAPQPVSFRAAAGQDPSPPGSPARLPARPCGSAPSVGGSGADAGQPVPAIGPNPADLTAKPGTVGPRDDLVRAGRAIPISPPPG